MTTGGRGAVANQNQWERVAREELDGHALNLTLTCQAGTLKVCCWSCLCTLLGECWFLSSLPKRTHRDCWRPSPHAAAESVDYYD